MSLLLCGIALQCCLFPLIALRKQFSSTFAPGCSLPPDSESCTHGLWSLLPNGDAYVVPGRAHQPGMLLPTNRPPSAKPFLLSFILRLLASSAFLYLALPSLNLYLCCNKKAHKCTHASLFFPLKEEKEKTRSVEIEVCIWTLAYQLLLIGLLLINKITNTYLTKMLKF